MIKATRFFFFDVDTSNCKAMISMIKATCFYFLFNMFSNVYPGIPNLLFVEDPGINITSSL